MKIREAELRDKAAWDRFVDEQEGSFLLYYDWKYFYETRGNQFIPLLIETDSSEIIGLCPLVKEKHFLHSVIISHPEGGSGGIFLKQDLPESQKQDALLQFVQTVAAEYSQGCATLEIAEGLSHFNKCNSATNPSFLEAGFRYSYNEHAELPCNHILELQNPFEETIWKNLWSHNLRKHISRASKNGITIIQDTEFEYKEVFIDMLNQNYKRHSNKRNIVEETEARFNIFKDRTKLFIALFEGRPVSGHLCHYTPSTCYLAKSGSFSKDTGYASHLCLKTAIEDACNKGYKFADFDTSGEPSVAQFKEQFGFTRVPRGTYELILSGQRHRLRQISLVAEEMRHDKLFLWKHRHKLLNQLLRR